MKFKQILVPTDFSENASKALHYAVEFAAQNDATVHLLHVPRIPTYSIADIAYSPGPSIVTEVLTYAQEALDKVEREVKAKGVACEASIASGTTHEIIARYAENHGIDLLVVGTHGRTGMAKFMFGSVTERVLKTVHPPILVVPPGGGRLPDNIVVAYDFSGASMNAAAAARALHGVIPGAIHLVHTYVDVWAEYADRGAAVGQNARRRVEAMQLGLTQMLETDAEELFSIDSGAAQLHLVEGDAVTGILTIAQEVRADLICAGLSGKGGLERLLLGSVARKLLRESPVPLLFTHAGEQ